MKIKAYLYFPDTKVAFQNLNNDENCYTAIIDELLAIKAKLRTDKDFELCYDQANVRTFIDVADGLVDGVYFSKISKQLRGIIGTKSTDVNLPNLRDPQFVYANWSISGMSVISSPLVVAEAAEAAMQDTANEKTICICLGDSIKAEREELHVIKDAVHKDSFPALLNVTATNSDIGFVKWITTLPAGKFSLKDKNNYTPLEKYWKKERIYKHNTTGQYWYFDFYHRENKIHYEVFDSTGNNHLGEADVDGNLQANTASTTKKINNIL